MRKLSRKKANRDHLVRNLAASLVLYETIDTTVAKAKETKTYVETAIARSKKNTLSERRNLLKKFFDENAAIKIIEELLPRYESRVSGFIRSYRLQNRLGDNSEMMRLELVDKKVFVDKEVKSEKETEKKEDPKTAKSTDKKEKKSDTEVSVKVKKNDKK